MFDTWVAYAHIKLHVCINAADPLVFSVNATATRCCVAIQSRRESHLVQVRAAAYIQRYARTNVQFRFCLFCVRLSANKTRRKNAWTSEQTRSLALVLMQPSLVLIDHGHFQYNSVCLGLAMAGAAAVAGGERRVGKEGDWTSNSWSRCCCWHVAFRGFSSNDDFFPLPYGKERLL